MTEVTWNIFKIAITKLASPPAWLGEFARRSPAEVEIFPKLDNTLEGQVARPVIEEKIVTPDYLDFLREQIQLNARGKEWTNLLQRRLNCLQPFLGKMLIIAHFFKKPNSITLRVHRETGELVYIEIY